MLGLADQKYFATRPQDTQRTPAEVISAFFEKWTERSKIPEDERPADIRDILHLIQRSWLIAPTLNDGYAIMAAHADDLIIGMLDAYTIHEIEPFPPPNIAGDLVDVPVEVRLSVPRYPDPDKEEFEMVEFRRKMYLRLTRENGEWGLDPNSILRQGSV